MMMARRAIFLLQLLAAPVAWGLGLDQAIDRQQQQAAKTDGECACLNWQDVYGAAVQRLDDDVFFHRPTTNSFNVICGAGFELTFSGGITEGRGFFRNICQNFFFHFETNVCVNQHVLRLDEDEYTTKKVGPQWCYVSGECKELNGGTRAWKSVSVGVGENAQSYKAVNTKFCKSGKDTLLREMTPNQLNEFAKKANVNVGWAARHAYPYFAGPWTWNEALKEVILSSNSTERKQKSWLPIHKKVMKLMKASETTPLLIETSRDPDAVRDGSDKGLAIVHKGSIYDITKNEKNDWHETTWDETPYTQARMRCIFGPCDK